MQYSPFLFIADAETRQFIKKSRLSQKDHDVTENRFYAAVCRTNNGFGYNMVKKLRRQSEKRDKKCPRIKIS